MKPEQVLHQAVAGYLAAVLAPEVVWTTIGHGGGGRVRGALLKSMGVLPGVPDIYLTWNTYALCVPRTGFIELKAAKGRLSPAQEAFRERVMAFGHSWALCRDLLAVQAALKLWRAPVRTHRILESGALRVERTL
jgi:hypothetical protein